MQNNSGNKVTVVLGAQWGDEGKGKLCDVLSTTSDVCARCQGGNNAGHTIVVDSIKYAVHLLPSGIVSPSCTALIGSGVVVHLESLFKELDDIEKKGLSTNSRILVSDRCHLVFDFHQTVDGLNEMELGASSIGTTRRGIGPTYSTKASRSGIRVHDLYNKEEFRQRLKKLVENYEKRYAGFTCDIEAEIAKYDILKERLRPMVVDSVQYLHEELASGKKILVEGANALFLDLDFGTYPYVTSSNTGIGGVLTGLGIPAKSIGNVIGVVKSYTTRVGEGPFPTELFDEDGKMLQEIGAEFGVTTGRSRRCGWLDLVMLKYSTIINGYTSFNLTKLDVLDSFKEIKMATEYIIDGVSTQAFPADLNKLARVEVVYTTFPGWNCSISKMRKFEELPENCKKFITFIEDYLQVPIEWIGVGVEREAMIHKV